MNDRRAIPSSNDRPSQPRGPWLARLVAAGLLGFSGLAPAASTHTGTGVTVAIQGPASVTPGTDFDVTLQVTGSGDGFNAFDAIVGYDPAALTLVPLSPSSLQQGAMMTGACGSTFHRFRTGSDRDTINLSLLCSGVSVNGPGAIYKLRFHASNTPQVTSIQWLSGLRFFNAGVLVAPTSSQGLTLGIGTTVGVGDGATLPLSGGIAAYPNPARSRMQLRARLPEGGAFRLEVSDVAGRRVRSLASGWTPAGERVYAWDGQDDAGRRVPAGLYVARLRQSGREYRASLIWIP